MRCCAFTDESGNTGLNLFDTEQESFWTGTLISYSDVDTKYRVLHEELLSTSKCTELHGAKLGFAGLEKIAARVAWFLRERKIRFSFGSVHKPFLAAAKLFDLVFDSGNNPAMPSHIYFVRTLRLMSMMHFVQLLDRNDLKEFWSLFAAQDAHRFGNFLDPLVDRVHQACFDPRTSQVLSEALKWGSQHPNAILDPFGKRDSPNLLAFSGLFDHLHTLYEEEGHTVGSFVHDEQNEFIKHIREHYELFSKWQFSKHHLSSVADVKMLPTFDCEMVVRSSSQSFGLQLVDICIWLVKRVIDKGDKPRGNCRLLFECLAERSQISRFDFNDLVQNVAAGVNYVAKLPLSDEDIEKGRALRDQFEQERISRISGKLPSD